MHRLSRAIIGGLALMGASCSGANSPPLKVGIYGELRRLDRPIAGSVVALLPKGTQVALAHTRPLGPGFELVVPSGSTYTIRGTASNGAACAPVTISIPRLKSGGGREPPWTMRHISCGRSSV